MQEMTPPPWWRRAWSSYRRASESMRAWNDRWLMPMAAVLLLAASILSTPELHRAWRSEGAPGVFTATVEKCRTLRIDRCHWTGTFRSDDGGYVYGVSYDGPGIDRAGDTTPAQATRADLREVYPPGERLWLFTMAAGALAGLYLCWWACRRRPWSKQAGSRKAGGRRPGRDPLD